ncbi:TauD/TfdA family dioxygenase [Streptomyces sp. AV19]|uniref:TauD/TfdA dioxygenase family protein n=1 Tax=Streptomyces sp. AV19 TaxID=2793068 RepID=UPI0018FE4EF4|nr:TauD/TfdA family dioxygenase [Streptomyces sp. AV19]MBH1937254.1 TauD/TfdA family dioxygenase [Streptomyces sp. AV19]MDG4536732.1 TauD/TfdA family dioxygenase [Streptomyces sp. AV19]
MKTVREGFVAETASADEVRQALAGHGVVVVRGRPDPDAAALEEFARALGAPQPVPQLRYYPPCQGSAYVHVIDSAAEKGPDVARWHTDQSFLPDPARYTVLQAQLLPARGGDTLFADMVRACEELPPGWREALDGATGTHVHPLRGETARHPVVITVPGSGLRALYVNDWCQTDLRGVGQPAPTLADLIAHAAREEFVHRHRWSPGDIVVWDNRRVLHRATPIGPGTRRIMHRVVVAGGR